MNHSCQLIYYECSPYARAFLRSETIASTAAEPRCLLKGCDQPFHPRKRANATTAKSAGMRRGNGRGGRPERYPPAEVDSLT